MAEQSMQALWSGTVSFSLVAIPVKMVRAVEPGRVSFRMLHGKDWSPLLRRMVCPADGQVVPPEEAVRGYEIAPEKFILVSDEELESVSPERSRTVEILEFIDLADVDPVYFDRPYYLVPSKGGEKAYRLLVEVMRRTNKGGLPRVVLTQREHLVALPRQNAALALFTLHWSDDMVPADDLAPNEAAADAAE